MAAINFSLIKGNLNDVIEDTFLLREGHIFRDGFVFTSGQKYPAIFNRIVVRKPEFARNGEGLQGFSYRTLEEHIEVINKCQIEKAVIYCDELDFILRCPSLNDIEIFPSFEAGDKFDYSVLYQMPRIRKLSCSTHYGAGEQYKTSLDYSRISGLEELAMVKNGHVGYETIPTIKKMWICDNKKIRSFLGLSNSPVLQEVTVLGCSIKSLEGIGNYPEMKTLDLWHNYSLTDISSLENISGTLTSLTIDACSKVKDFSVLEKLENLEFLQLDGNNVLPNLKFLENMKKLKMFVFTMNVEDGDLSNCIKIPYASCKNRKHYNYKDKDLPKNRLSQSGIVD